MKPNAWRSTSWISDNTPPQSPGEPVGRRSTSDDAKLLDAYSKAVIGVVERVGPAVVTVSAHTKQDGAGVGSGFVITADVYALTNRHVVGGRPRLRVIPDDGDSLDAALIL